MKRPRKSPIPIGQRAQRRTPQPNPETRLIAEMPCGNELALAVHAYASSIPVTGGRHFVYRYPIYLQESMPGATDRFLERCDSRFPPSEESPLLLEVLGLPEHLDQQLELLQATLKKGGVELDAANLKEKIVAHYSADPNCFRSVAVDSEERRL